MTDEHAHRIANLAVALDLAKKSLRQYEQQSDHGPSDAISRLVPETQRKLDDAIETMLVELKASAPASD